MTDYSAPAAGQLPDPTASYEAQSAAIAAQVAAKFDTLPTDPVVPAQIAPVETQVAAPTPNVSAPDPIEKVLARLADMEAKISEARKPVAEPTRDDRRVDPNHFYLNPTEALRALGVDPLLVTRTMVAQVMGDQASPELRAQVAVGAQFQGVQGELASLRGELESLRKENASFRTQNEVNTLASGVDSTQYPALASMEKANPEWTRKALYEVVNSGVPVDKARTLLETKLSPLYAAFRPATQPASAPPTGSQNATIPVPANPSGLAGAPSPVATNPHLTWEQKTQATLDEVLKKFGIPQ